MENSELFLSILKKWNIHISKDKFDKFEIYKNELLEINEKINLTAIVNDNDVYIKHFIDSISSVNALSFSNQSMCDIGTGAGFPGLPLKIIFDKLKMTFIDSSNKKIESLKKICRKLEIFDCEFISDNIENIGRSNLRDSQDVVVVRAVGQISLLMEYGIPLLKPKGKMLIYKGFNVEKEVENSHKALELLSSKIDKKVEFTIPFTDIKRNIVVVEKLNKTSDKYPRRVGIPKKRPL